MRIVKKSLRDILGEFDKIIIPDVQRDYVMGSGGKKFEDLLTAIIESIQKNKKFNFSCLVGYKDKNNYFYVYDGQQRLVTLVYLCAYLIESTKTEESKLLKKFSFTGRDLANLWLETPKNIEENMAVDFTTYSLAKLIEGFNKIKPSYYSCRQSDEISFDFLFDKVIFDMILTDKISDAEQFFLDINDGLDLKPYEVFKAELFHHTSELFDQDSFKKFALKMENKWLKFFLTCLHEGNNTNNCEEEMLIFFLQYCFRMMWIEENGSEEGYESTNINWLTKEHLARFECILDAIINEMKNDSLLSPDLPSSHSCINYSIELSQYQKYPIDYCKGQHWNISDKNYIGMLKTFLSNIYNLNETNKDVVIWCYISKLPLLTQNKNVLYEYLRFVKKLLNNNRKLCNYAKIEYGSYGPDNKYIYYARYYTLGIPQYYTQCKDEKCDTEMFYFLNSILMLNNRFELGVSALYIDNCIKDCENELLKTTLIRERKKQKASDKCNIKKYENLSFINGLVDNFLTYTEETCNLQEFCNEEFYLQLRDIHSRSKNNQQYKDIFKFIYENKVNLKKILFSDVYISWVNYCGTAHRKKGFIIPHNWCDFFTSENGIPFDESPLTCPLHTLPDGWISADMKIVQPVENDVGNKSGFAAYAEIKELWDIMNFFENFTYILLDKEHAFIINGTQSELLPDWLKRYNSEDWIIKKLSKDTKVYFSEKDYLNTVLRYGFKVFMERNEGEKMDAYLKENTDKMQFIEMYGNKFLIKL